MKSKDINFEYIEEFVDYVVEEVENNKDIFVTVIAKFDEAKEILKNLMLYEDVNFESLQIESPIMDNYCDEFVISLWMNDDVLEIGCEKLKDEQGHYTNPGADSVYLFSDCSSKIIPLCEGSDLYFVDIEDECDCDEECDECCSCAYHNNDMCEECYDIHGFAVSKEDNGKHYDFCYYTSDTLREKDICSILKEFGF